VFAYISCLGLNDIGAVPIVPSLLPFDQNHLNSVRDMTTWTDCGKGMTFIGRSAFTKEVQGVIKRIAKRKPDKQLAIALVYSCVSGSGKTVSFLRLKETLLEESGKKPIVAYLGFNTNLMLSIEEEDHITLKGQGGAREVLARRLVAAAVISMNNPEAVTSLPAYKEVYEGRVIPTVKKSKELLLQLTSVKPDSPCVIVCGVDEVQLLNSIKVNEIGLGRYFLRTLRIWQAEWYDTGLRIVPIGTGIAINWGADPSTGDNISLHGRDSVLISKRDFRSLVTSVVAGLGDTEFRNRFPVETSKQTIIDLISAAYWPRVRLLEWWRDGELGLIHTADADDADDGNADDGKLQLRCAKADVKENCWPIWLQVWMIDDGFSINDGTYVPGIGSEDRERGKIYALFQLLSDGFQVIPDGYASSSIVKVLKQKLPVPGLYEDLDCIRSLDPTEFILRDWNAFESYGFHVVGASIYIGLQALQGKSICSATATKVQKKRLGLALWLNEQGAINNIPIVNRGPAISTSVVGPYYPFTDAKQTAFDPKMAKQLKKALIKRQPVYIRCGKKTICDYIYLYVRLDDTDKAEWIAIIADAKHTGQALETGNGETVTADDQQKLFDALTAVYTAVAVTGAKLSAVRLMFVTNRSGFTRSNDTKLIKAKQTAQNLFSDVKLELLNSTTFDFGPFSDIMFARKSE
jgi:hypothetical protein